MNSVTSIREDDMSGDNFDYSFLLKKRLDDGMYHITDAFKAKFVKVVDSKPDFFLVHPEEYALVFKQDNDLSNDSTIL